MVQVTSDAPRWLLLAALLYAPWAYGSIPAGALAGLNTLLLVTFLLWVTDAVVRRRWPPLSLWLVVPCVALILQAWWMAINGDQGGGVTRSFRWAPGSVDQELSVGMALRVTTLLATGALVYDMARHRHWRQRLWWTLALTGGSIVLLGLVQRVGGAPGTFWRLDPDAPTFFATFPYHATAGAFLNLVWPVMAGLLTVALRDQAPPWQRVLWTLSLAGCLGGLLVNTSRGSGFVAVVLVGVWVGGLLLLRARRHREEVAWPAFSGQMLAILALAGLLAVAIGVDRTVDRWRQLEGELHAGNPRWQADITSLRIVGDAGATGFGPGTFARVYPLYGSGSAAGFDHAHNDYLQTLIEWGLLGTVSWAILFFGGPVRTGLSWAGRLGSRRTRDHVLAFAGLAAWFGVALHALVDYPLQVPSIQVYAVVLAGLLWSYPVWNGRTAMIQAPAPLGTLGDWMNRHPHLCPSETEGQADASPEPSTDRAAVRVRAHAGSPSICVVFNPTARGNRAARFRKHLNDLGPDCALKPTTAPGGGRELAAQAVREGFGCVVAAGGDGTLNEVLNGMADVPDGFERVCLGLLPLGTSNVFARELGIPMRWDRAWQIILRGRERNIDLVRATYETGTGRESRCFVQLAGAGLDARAVELVDWDLKQKVGYLAYVIAAFRALREPQPRITIETGARTAQGQLVLIGNGQRYGGPFRLFPQANPGDGLLDAHVYGRVDAALALASFWGFLTGRLGRVGPPDRLRAASMRLSSTVRTPFQVDGEHVGQLPVDLELEPRALRVITP
jgi:diacylglycerol kinase (ATP)